MSKYKLTAELQESVDNVMSSLVDNIIKLKMDEIADYEFPLDEPFGLQIIHNDEIYCFMIRFSSTNKNFICLGPGAHNRDVLDKNGNVKKPPFFVRWSWYKHLEESTIAYADPMMFHSDEIVITWFTGGENHWQMEDVAAIIEKLAENQKVINENILFFGSSGGGFSSVMLGTLIKGSKVLVNNAQFFVMNYGKQFVDRIFELLEVEFNGLSREEIIEKYKFRIDALELFRREKYTPPITYYINSKAKIDIKLQLPPLVDGYFDIYGVNPLKIILYEDPEIERPHNPLPTDETLDIIRLFCNNNLYNSGDEGDDGNIIPKGHFDDSIINDELESKNREIAKLKSELESIKSSKSYRILNKFR